MKIINRTMKGLALFAATIAAFGSRSAEVAEMGGHVSWQTPPPRYGNLPSNAAAQKRVSRRNRNIRARAKK